MLAFLARILALAFALVGGRLKDVVPLERDKPHGDGRLGVDALFAARQVDGGLVIPADVDVFEVEFGSSYQA